MQALCAPTESTPDIKCPVCRKGFRLFWERRSESDQEADIPGILLELRAHHEDPESKNRHPETAFNIPAWSGLPQFSGAALLGGAY
jgi:hypothetical protein